MLRINTSIASLTAQRHFERNNLLLDKAFERLSSGLRINRAADDAAGLAISSKMKTQIRGLSQASRNVQDSISLLNVADGSLDNIANKIQRIRELGIQSANGTLTFSDREKIQLEVDELIAEIDREARTTEFNKRKLLDGSISSSRVGDRGYVEIVQNSRIGDQSVTVPNMTNLARFVEPDALSTFTPGGDIDLVTSIAAEHFIQEYRFVLVESVPPNMFYGDFDLMFETVITDNEPATIVDQPGTVSQLRAMFGDFITIGVFSNGVTMGGIELNVGALTLTDANKSTQVKFGRSLSPVTIDKSLTFQVGANEGQFVKLGIDDVTAHGLQIEGLQLLPQNFKDKAAPVFGANVVQAATHALNRLNSIRAKVGAFQNRLESTLANLSITRENLTSSNSRIEDADYAMEVSKLTRAQILQQAGTAILSNANSNDQIVLNLLS